MDTWKVMVFGITIGLIVGGVFFVSILDQQAEQCTKDINTISGRIVREIQETSYRAGRYEGCFEMVKKINLTKNEEFIMENPCIEIKNG